jgi:hypothetical protein
MTEFSSALSVEVRNRQIEAVEQTKALAASAPMCGGIVTVLPLLRGHFRGAATLALRLEVCADYGAELCTLDRRLASAGPMLGVKTLLL